MPQNDSPNTNPKREQLLKALPLIDGPLVIRNCTRDDLSALSRWPEYQPPFDVFRFSFAGDSDQELDGLYELRQAQPERVTLVCDWSDRKCVGYTAIQPIDWDLGVAQNMGIRIHPDWCSKGIGSNMIRLIRDWWFANGMKTLRLDVAGSNERAIRCYRSCGFAVIDELWREAPDLQGIDIDAPEWQFVKGHVRNLATRPELRFWVMETTKSETENLHM